MKHISYFLKPYTDNLKRDLIKEKKDLSYSEFMNGMCNAPFDRNKCEKCGGNGLKPVMCCSGAREECGCRGMPTDFICCECGTSRPTNEQIRSWI